MEKDAFFKQLPGQLPNIPKPIAQKRLLPQLAQALEFGGAPASALGEIVGTYKVSVTGLSQPRCTPPVHTAPQCLRTANMSTDTVYLGCTQSRWLSTIAGIYLKVAATLSDDEYKGGTIIEHCTIVKVACLADLDSRSTVHCCIHVGLHVGGHGCHTKLTGFL